MGNSDSKLSFKQDIFKLSEPSVIPLQDPYWRGFWDLPESAEDVFSLFTPVDVRRARDSSIANLETLIISLTTRLFRLQRHRAFPNPEVAPANHALNCIRVLTRVLPFLYEEDRLESWEDNFFWTPRRKKVQGGRKSKAEVLFDESKAAEFPELEDEDEEAETYEDLRPLGEELVDTLIDMLFLVGFTLPSNERSKEKVTYAIWEKGVGSTVPMTSSKELENNRIEILRLLLTLSSKSLYMPAHLLPIKGVKALTYLATCPDKQIVLSMLCSLLNTTINYNSAAWRVPYDHVIYKDSKQVLVTYSLELLLACLLYPVPEEGKGVAPKNNYRHFLGRVHRLQDFEFLVDGMRRTLSQPLQASASYLPGSQRSVDWAPEMIMLFWESLQCNRRFRSFIIDSDHGHEIMKLMLFYALEYRLDPAKQGVVRMCAFVMQTLSTETNFGKQLNRKFEENNTLPPMIKINDFEGTHADFMMISIHTLITTSKGKIDAIYPSLLATISNVAPYVESLGVVASSKIVQLFGSMSAPSFLLANETNYALLQSLLESINAMIEHQYFGNQNLVQTIFKARKKFESLRSFTLESGQEEIERINERRKAAASAPSGLSSPTRASRNSSVESARATLSARSPSLSNVPEEDNTFAIGEDDDSETEDQSTVPLTPSQSSPSNHTSREPSVSSVTSGDVPLPTQLRGMSEKARGKMPAGQPSFSRQNSTSSLSSHPGITTGVTGSSALGFDPTHAWIDTWLPTLPLHTVLTLLSYPQPPSKLPPTVDATPPRIQLFEWTTLSLGWYESLLWGFIFTSEMLVQKGTVGIWNGTSIRLFRVERDTASGPSLMKPMGAVDAVGSRLVSGVKSLGSGTATRVSSGGNGVGADAQRSGRIRDV